MNEDIVTNKLNQIFRKVFKDPGIKVTNEMAAKDVEKWDSLSHLILISTIESEFRIKFKLKELIAMKNVGDLIQSISSKI
ncbi:MAG: acyl carrier protein [Bacteroidales bacterium]|nr:acyl carrier protein [Bacteroidales bacterium]